MFIMEEMYRGLFVLIAVAVCVQAQWDTKSYFNPDEQIEKRYTSELVEELTNVHDDALLLYTEFSARSGGDYKTFVKTLRSFFVNNALNTDEYAPESCKTVYGKALYKMEVFAIKSASYSAENHHKFFLGPMTVFRMHLNKTENLLERTKKHLHTCAETRPSIKCETIPSVLRWRKLAAAEINRVKSDIAHIRPIYRDLLVHFKRRLNRLWKGTEVKLKIANESFRNCINDKNSAVS